jgi:hypothetical protein
MVIGQERRQRLVGRDKESSLAQSPGTMVNWRIFEWSEEANGKETEEGLAEHGPGESAFWNSFAALHQHSHWWSFREPHRQVRTNSIRKQHWCRRISFLPVSCLCGLRRQVVHLALTLRNPIEFDLFSRVALRDRWLRLLRRVKGEPIQVDEEISA